MVSINEYAAKSGRTMKEDSTVINEADILAAVYDPVNNVIKTSSGSSGSNYTVTTTEYQATATVAGSYNSGDLIDKFDTFTNAMPPVYEGTVWRNVTQETTLASAPAAANLSPMGGPSTVAVSNFPATQPVSGTVNIGNEVQVKGDSANPVPVTLVGSSDSTGIPVTATISGIPTIDIAPGQSVGITGTVPISMIDGANVTLGAKADTQATDFTSAWSVVALLKFMGAKIAGILTVTTGRDTAIGNKTIVATAGTPISLGSQACGDGIIVIANPANTGNIYVFPVAGAKANVIPLAPGDSNFWSVANINELYVDADTSR